MKILTIIGARPQIIKAAALSRAVRNSGKDIREVIVHTGQHYDENMSQVFFDELQIPHPDYNLGVGSGEHGKQTAKMMAGIEKILFDEKPDVLVVYGDTNSTLAGAIAAAKIHIPVAHIEAGLRSFNKSMPEEINRICCDHCSTLLFSPTKTGFDNLVKEGFSQNTKKPFTIDRPGIYHCGDIMYDNSLHFAKIAEQKSDIIERAGVKGKTFTLCTIHRDSNTDNPTRLNNIFEALNEISNKSDIVLPLHPRTKKMMTKNLDKQLLSQTETNSRIHILPPVSFLDMIMLENEANIVLTDSGGVQKEAYFFKKPCVIMRGETEWVEIVETGAAALCDADKQTIIEKFDHFENKKDMTFPAIFGDGKAAEFILGELIDNIERTQIL